MAKGFTPEELAAMAAWDAEIDASDEEDWELNDLIEELVNPDTELQKRKHEEYVRREERMTDEEKKARNARNAEYVAKNKEAVRESRARYYAANRDRIRARQREAYLRRKAKKAAENA